jgi:hypothetical protein
VDEAKVDNDAGSGLLSDFTCVGTRANLALYVVRLDLLGAGDLLSVNKRELVPTRKSSLVESGSTVQTAAHLLGPVQALEVVLLLVDALLGSVGVGVALCTLVG